MCARRGGTVSGPRSDVPAALLRWSLFHGAAMVGAAVPAFVLRSCGPLIAAGAASMVFLAAVSARAGHGLKSLGGRPNLVTLGRFLGLLLTVAFHDSLSGPLTSGLLAVLVLLDGLDGYLARRFDRRTEFGARFDNETDSLFVCLSGVLLYFDGSAPAWVLVPSFLRYVSLLVVLFSGFVEIPGLRTPVGRPAGLAMSCSLVLSFSVPAPYRTILLALSSVLVVVSFSVSFALLAAGTHASPVSPCGGRSGISPARFHRRRFPGE